MKCRMQNNFDKENKQMSMEKIEELKKRMMEAHALSDDDYLFHVDRI